MDLTLALSRYAHALGRWQAAWSFAAPELRRKVGVAQVSAAWDVFRRDAGSGDVGRAHEEQPDRTGVTVTDDPRRDGMLLWLAYCGSGAIAEAADLVGRLVGVARRFGAQDQELLQVAREALIDGGRGPIARLLPNGDGDDVLASLQKMARAVDRLRADPAFLESAGAEVRHRMPAGMVGHYVPAAPGGAWALNLVLLGDGSLSPAPGLVSRAVFRPDAEPEECATMLIDGATSALAAFYRRTGQIQPQLDRGSAALSHLSRNARAREAWGLIVSLGVVTRSQLGRALGLSRAGADIQARALAEAGLVTLGANGRVDWRRDTGDRRDRAPLADRPLGRAAAELDAVLADVGRLLSRTSC